MVGGLEVLNRPGRRVRFMRNAVKGLAMGSFRLVWTVARLCQQIVTYVLILLGALAFLSMAYGCCSLIGMN